MANKRYYCKFYRDNEYIVTLNNIVSDFTYSQDINTAGAVLSLEIAASFDDVGATYISESLTDESGNHITDENGIDILVSESYEFNTIPIDMANRVEVWLAYSAEPEGKRVFDGIIMNDNIRYSRGSIIVRAASEGVKLKQHLIESSGSSIIESFTSIPNEYAIARKEKGGSTDGTRIAQTFTVPSSTSIRSIVLPLRQDAVQAGAKLSVYLGTPTSPGSLLGTVTAYVTATIQTDTEFVLPSPIDMSTSTTYFWQLENINYDATIYIGHNTAGGYANGDEYTYASSTWSSAAGDDVGFKLYTTVGGAIGGVFNSYEPSAIMRALVDNFTRVGGRITYNSTSIDDTGTSVSYEFAFNPIQEGIDKVLELAPSNWYYYVDPGENILHFHRQGTSADHTFVLKKHIEDIELDYSIDDLKNDGYLTGGDVAGTNLLVHRSNPSSIEKYGTWLSAETDNRVTLESTAETIILSTINQYSEPVWRTTVTILSTVYDIETINLGDMVKFRNFGNLIDSLLLVVAGIDKKPDSITLRLQSTLPSVSHRIEDIKRNLDNVMTINNPDQAS